MVRRKVVILGGGVGGMSAAHELLQRSGWGVDFDVHIYERAKVAGGKARSIAVRGPGASMPVPRAAGAEHRDLPGEHGFRFFPGFYRHLPDTMKNIPVGGRSVVENLVEARHLELARTGKPPVVVSTRFPQSLQEFALLAQDAFADLGLSRGELGFFAVRMWQLLTSCSERRLAQYEKMKWWDFLDADNHSTGYRDLLVEGLSRSLLANNPKLASARTVGNTNLQLLLGLLKCGGQSIDRVLNGPTSEAWIIPWLQHLQAPRAGSTFAYHFEHEATRLHVVDKRISAVTVRKRGEVDETVTGDYFIFAVPVERMARLIEVSARARTGDVIALDRSLAGILRLKNKVAWMNGIQFFLYRPLRDAIPGHRLFVDSPWSLTAISEGQFWKSLAPRGDGTVREVLSVCISNWDAPGVLSNRSARESSHDEIAEDVWAQLKQSLNVVGAEVLRDADRHSWFLDRDIIAEEPEERTTERYDDMEPLLINCVDTWQLRPASTTKIPGTFLASDYVQTNTDVACMEAANEAARAAVNGVLDASGSTAPRCDVWPLHEPAILAPLRSLDRLKFKAGLPWSFGMPFSSRASAPEALGAYVERGGEQCHLPPYACNKTRMFGFVVKGSARAVQTHVIDPCLNTCAGDAFDFRALSDRALITFADAVDGRSLLPPDAQKGSTREKSCVIWTPVVSLRGGLKVCMFVSYIVVDNPWSLAAGREVHGFPKELGSIEMPEAEDAGNFAASALVMKAYGPSKTAELATLLAVTRTTTGVRDHPGWQTPEAALREIFSLWTEGSGSFTIPGESLVVDMIERIAPPAIPMIFLKQFRDAADGTRACYQALIEAKTTVTAIRSGHLLPGRFDITCANFASHPLGSDLGFADGPAPADFGFFADIDFAIGPGKEIWRRAP